MKENNFFSLFVGKIAIATKTQTVQTVQCTIQESMRLYSSVNASQRFFRSLYYERWSCFPLKSDEVEAGGRDGAGCGGGAVRA